MGKAVRDVHRSAVAVVEQHRDLAAEVGEPSRMSTTTSNTDPDRQVTLGLPNIQAVARERGEPAVGVPGGSVDGRTHDLELHRITCDMRAARVRRRFNRRRRIG